MYDKTKQIVELACDEKSLVMCLSFFDTACQKNDRIVTALNHALQ